MGSHIIDLIQFIIEEDDYILKSSKINSVITDIDDIVEAKPWCTENKIDVSILLKLGQKNVRKPIFSLTIEMLDGRKYLIDQQQIKRNS